MTKPPTFNGEVEKIVGFLMVYKLYIRIRIRKVAVEEQIQWMLSYIQGELVYISKENVVKDLEEESLEYETVGEFLADLKKELSREDNEIMKIVELKNVEQKNKTIEKFV